MSPADPPTIERLFEHAAFARSLARGLLRDEHAADDVVQDAYVAAIESGPPQNPRGWFATVARNMSLNVLRGRKRRAAHETLLPDRGAEEPPETALVRRETLRSVFEAVLALDEPFQTVVLLRFYEDLTPAEIAARLGVPPATVRTRLHRGLAMLRERLDRENDGDRRAWCAALAPFAGLERGAPPAVPAATTAATIGGLIVAKKLLTAAVALVLLGSVAWLVLPKGDAANGGRPGTTETESASAAPAPRRARGERDAAGAAQTETASAPADETMAPPEGGPAWIAGRVVDDRTGAPVAGAEIVVLTKDGGEAEYERAKPYARSGADGRFTCAGLLAGEHHIAARAPDHLDAHAPGAQAVESGGAELTLVLRYPRTIRGRVVPPPGVSALGVEVFAAIPHDRGPKWNWWTNVDRAARTDADGAFVLERLPPGEFDVWARLKSDAREYSASLSACPADGPSLTLTLDEDEATILRTFRLDVLDPAGRRVAAATARRYSLSWNGTSSSGEKESKDGTFAQDLPALVKYEWYEVFRYTDADGRTADAAPVRVRLGGPEGISRTIRLSPPVSMTGRVVDAAGAGVAGAVVSALPADLAPDEKGGDPESHARATSGADGSFRLDGLADREYLLTIDVPPQFVAREPVRAKPGTAAAIPLSAALHPAVTVKDAAGAPVANADVALFDGDEDDAFSRATTDASGAARLGRVPPGRSFRLEVYANDDRFAKLVLDSWSPADATLTMPPGLSLRGTVVDPHGAPVPGARVVLQRRGDPDTERERTDDRGRFQFDRLAAGDVELRVSLDGPEPPPDAPVVTATPGGGTVTITIDPGLILRAKVDGWGDRDNSVIVGCPWFVEDGEKPVLHAGSHRAGRLSFTGLPRGRTGTIVFGPLNGGFLAFRPGVATDAGEVTVSLVRGATLSGRIRLPDGVPDQAAEPRVWAEVIGVGVAGRYAGRGRWLVEGVPESTWTVKAKLQFDGREYTAETTARPGVPADLELR